MASQSYVWLITGTSRGIGMEMTRQLLQSPMNTVIATCRNPAGATGLQALKTDLTLKGTLHVVQLDVADETSIRNSVKPVNEILSDRGIDYLYNNAATTEWFDTAFEHSYSGMIRTFQANVAGPALIAQLYIPYILRSSRKVIVNMSTGLASFGLNCGPKCVSYSISKTALNMLTYKQATNKPEIIAISLDPGWVKTEMGGEGAFLEPSDSVAGIIKTLQGLTSENSGKFYRYNGESIIW
ncbi:hypothetical protein BKA93DRAFT_748543 [Sparassis latifolia]